MGVAVRMIIIILRRLRFVKRHSISTCSADELQIDKHFALNKLKPWILVAPPPQRSGRHFDGTQTGQNAALAATPTIVLDGTDIYRYSIIMTEPRNLPARVQQGQPRYFAPHGGSYRRVVVFASPCRLH